MKTKTVGIHLASFLACLVLLPAISRAQADITGLLETLKTFHYGDNTAALDTLAARVTEARLSQMRRRETARALASILPSSATFEAKQFACRQLVFVAGDEEVPALAALLLDPALAHYALLALARIRTTAVADALARALPQSSGRPEIEILNTLADLGDARAVAAALDRLRAGDSALRATAAAVLGKMGDGHAVETLLAAYAGTAGATRVDLGHALLAAASRIQKAGDANASLSIYDMLDRSPASPLIAAAALRGIAAVRGEQALPLVLQALGQEGTLRQEAAAAVLREMPGHAVAEHLAAAAMTMHGKGQLLALAILGDRADPAGASAVAALCRAPNPEVRLAALHAAGSIGDAAIVPLLLSAAASSGADDRAAARDSLVRLRGATVDRALLAVLDAGSPSAQVQAIQALGQRGAMGVAPRLVKAARSANPGVSAAALRVLRDQGTPALLQTLVDLTLAMPPNRRDAAVDAVTQIARRSTDPRTGALLLERLATAGKPADRVTMVSVVAQVGGPGAMEALRKASADPTAEVRLAALSALAEWPNDEPINDLLRIARAAPDARHQAIALRGYLRMVGGSDQRTPAQALALFKEAAPIATRPEERRLILAGLAKIPSLGALEYGITLLADRDVRPEAELAVVEIGRTTIGAWPEQSRAALEPIANHGVNADARARATSVLAVSRLFGDFIVAWEVSPSYQREGVDYIRLFDIAFPPEEGAADAVPWRLMPVGATPAQPWLLDLLALWGGEQRVAYLRTAVRCEAARDLVLEMGSDDGLKVWWNGEAVLSHNIARAAAPGQEKVTVHARAFWNQLLLKVTQNNQGWGAIARITNPDGTPAAGIRFAVPSSLKATDLRQP